ncbi:TPA: hypothetical protein JD342_24120, partial [Citrobacter freundii]|nr:hypothetical protein [Citrobacter freundii]
NQKRKHHQNKIPHRESEAIKTFYNTKLIVCIVRKMKHSSMKSLIFYIGLIKNLSAFVNELFRKFTG